MRFRFQLVVLIITCVMLYIPVSGEEGSDLKITGKLVKVDSGSGIIYIMHDSRIVKFRASKEICHRFSSSLQSFVEIGYLKCSEKGFCINSMELISEENYSKTVSPELKVKK